MILYKLKELECGLNPLDPEEGARLEVVRSLLRLMLEVDLRSETLMDDSAEKVLTMLAFIQQAPLTDLQRAEIMRLMLR